MNIFDFAMQMEKDGEAYYRDLVEKITDPGVRTILLAMAEEEVKHYHIFKAMKTGHPEMAESDIMSTVKNVFEELSGKGDEELKSFGEEAVAAYRQAQDVEKKSEDLYREKAAEQNDPEKAAIMNRIADEEHRHWQILDNMIEMVQSPGRWLEDAEWRHSTEF